MTDNERWRMWVAFILVSVIVGGAGLLVAIASLSRTGMVVDVGFMGLVAVVIAFVALRSRRRPGLLVPPHLQALDPESRQLVSRAVQTGGRTGRTDLAGAVATHARRTQTLTVLLLLSWAVIVAIRIARLASGDSGVLAFLDVSLFVLVALGVPRSVRTLARARRAVAANRGDVR